ncbi:unnamed protein product, partial [Scytosiphon promiscuus]
RTRHEPRRSNIGGAGQGWICAGGGLRENPVSFRGCPPRIEMEIGRPVSVVVSFVSTLVQIYRCGRSCRCCCGCRKVASWFARFALMSPMVAGHFHARTRGPCCR